MATMFNLPDELAEEILSRVQLTSLSSVRSTCRKWGTLSQNRGIGNERDFIDSSIKQVSILDQVEITQVFHREGLLLCITKDKFKILVWNPYLGQTREEKLAVLHVSWVNAHAVEIWVTNKIDPGAVSWIKFVRSISVFVDDLAGNFFITRKSKLLWVTI
ncbi:unnamed protein product [Brassica rapa subsp. trilocularis]